MLTHQKEAKEKLKLRLILVLMSLAVDFHKFSNLSLKVSLLQTKLIKQTHQVHLSGTCGS